MTKRTTAVVLFTCISIMSLFALPKVAVLDIIAQKGIDPSVIVPVTESIMEEVVGTRAYMVLDRAYVAQILKEQEFNLSAMVNDTQAAQAGQFLGADYVVTGKVQLLGDAFFLVAKMIEVRTGVIVAQSSAQGEGKLIALLEMAHAVGRKVVAGAPISPLSPSTAVTAKQPAPAKRIKAGFVTGLRMVDLDQTVVLSIKRLQNKYKDWLDIAVVERVTPESAAAAFDKLATVDACDIVYSCMWELAEQCSQAAKRHPQVVFENVGVQWDHGIPNMGVYGVNDIGHVYLEGLVAGALSASGKVGFLSEDPSQGPWVYQMVNLFALGVKAANSKAIVYNHFLPKDHWWSPGTQAAAAKALVGKGCDFIGGVDGGEVFETLNSLAMSGKRARMFQKDLSYTRMRNVIVSGPIRDFADLFEIPLLALKAGEWKSEAIYPESASKFGGGEQAFNPMFLDELRAKKVKTTDFGEIALLDLLDRRTQQIRAGDFDPMTGPIKDQNGKLRLAAGMHADSIFLEGMNWLVENVK